jgi:hypothetical protein
MPKRLLTVAAFALAQAACVTDFSEVAPRGGWREAAERACMDGRAKSPSIAEGAAIVEDLCGIDYPLNVSALLDGKTAFRPAAVLGCPLTEVLDAWLRESVQPAAVAWIGSPVIEIQQLSSYACRKRNNIGMGLSEHAFGNALDIAGFKFANGRQISMAKDWRGAPEVQAFLREIQATACQRFTTVLSPGSNFMHYNHIHLDLAAVAPDNSPKMCKPPPEVTPPQRAPIDGELLAVAPGPAPTGAPPTSNEPTAVPSVPAGNTAIPGAD